MNHIDENHKSVVIDGRKFQVLGLVDRFYATDFEAVAGRLQTAMRTASYAGLLLITTRNSLLSVQLLAASFDMEEERANEIVTYVGKVLAL